MVYINTVLYYIHIHLQTKLWCFSTLLYHFPLAHYNTLQYVLYFIYYITLYFTNICISFAKVLHRQILWRFNTSLPFPRAHSPLPLCSTLNGTSPAHLF